MIDIHDETRAIASQSEECKEGDSSGSMSSLVDSCPHDSEDTSEEGCEWRIQRQNHPPAEEQLKMKPKRKSDHRLSIKSPILRIASNCQVDASAKTVPPKLGSCSSLPISSNLSSSSSSSILSSAHQSIITNTTTIMVRRSSNRSHRYLDDESSLGPDGSDIFTICDSTSITHHNCMEEWSHHNNTIRKNNKSHLDMVKDSVHQHRMESWPQSCIDDGNDSCYSDDRDWSPMEDMTVWSLDWTEQPTSILHSPVSSPGSIQECDWRNLYLLQDSPTTSPLCQWDMFYGTNTGQGEEVDSSTTGVSCGNDEDNSPLLWLAGSQLSRMILSKSTGRTTESSMSSSTDTNGRSSKSTWFRKEKETRLECQTIHRGASKAAMFLQLPELNGLAMVTTTKALSHQLSWSEKTAMTDATGYSTCSDSMDSKGMRIVTRSHVSWDESSLSCHKKDAHDTARSTDTLAISPKMDQIYTVDCDEIGWDHRPTSSVIGSVGMWSQCDEDAIDSGSDWILVVVTGWSDGDEMEMFHVHRTVLVESSTFFRRELLDNSVKDKGYSIVELDQSLVKAIPDLLDFVYRSKYSHLQPFLGGNALDPTWMDPATAFSLRRLGDYFGIVDLKQAVDQLFE